MDSAVWLSDIVRSGTSPDYLISEVLWRKNGIQNELELVTSDRVAMQVNTARLFQDPAHLD